jgi:fumarylacetoacetase
MRSFVEVPRESHFPIQNLPFGIFSSPNSEQPRVGIAIGDLVLDLALLEDDGFFTGPHLKGRKLFSQPALNPFMAQGRPAWREARQTIQHILGSDNPLLRDDVSLRKKALIPMADVEMHLPASVGDYTDFYSSREHATNVGAMFRGPKKALQPNWLHLPVAYHGRASSIVPSGTDIRRPLGQIVEPGASQPSLAPSREMDFELEIGQFVGPGNDLGQPISIDKATDHIFGLVLVNDWSARDIQRWEYRPLGPFLSKNLATSISPWVVTLDALEPFRCPGPEQDPEPLPYLRSAGNWAYDIHLEVQLQSIAQNNPATVSHSNARYLYWNMCQQVAHHTIAGCNLRPGDLLATGTISGPTPNSAGSMLELSWRGERPLQLPGNETRTFLKDGDTVTMTGWCQGDGFRVGFGELTGRIAGE